MLKIYIFNSVKNVKVYQVIANNLSGFKRILRGKKHRIQTRLYIVKGHNIKSSSDRKPFCWMDAVLGKQPTINSGERTALLTGQKHHYLTEIHRKI